MIQLEKVSHRVRKHGKGVNVLQGVDFAFNQDRIGIVSDNEAVSEAVVDLLAGYAVPQTGKIRRFGRVSWPIGRLLQFRSELHGADTLRFLCDIYRLDFQKSERFMLDLVDFKGLYRHPVAEWPGLLSVAFAHAAVLLPDFEIYLGEGSMIVGDDDFMDRWLPLFEQRLDTNSTLILSCAQQVYMERFCKYVATVCNGQIMLYESPDVAFSKIDVAQLGTSTPLTVGNEVDIDDF